MSPRLRLVAARDARSDEERPTKDADLVPWRYGMGCRLKNSHIIGLALKSVTP
jgi:hypothetical protein